jgi:hypothetical protein
VYAPCVDADRWLVEAFNLCLVFASKRFVYLAATPNFARLGDPTTILVAHRNTRREVARGHCTSKQHFTPFGHHLTLLQDL